MKIFCSGSTGFVGRYVIHELRNRDCVVTDNLALADAVIHLAWAGLPNYENAAHFRNIGWQYSFLKEAVEFGITNITITGTCLETLKVLVPYSMAKLALRSLAFELLPSTKWARLWYLYGEGQNENCLLPRLRKVRIGGEFSIIDGDRDFMDVQEAAEHICDIALQTKVTGIIDVCTGVAQRVDSFCLSQAPCAGIKFFKNYMRPYYEPFSFCGNPAKLNTIEHAR